MELSDLRSFVVLAEELHYGRAADRLRMTPSPLSRQIRRLEDELEARLFRRTTRRVELTDAGRAFLPEVRAVLDAAERAAAAARSVHRGDSGRLVVAAITPAIDGFLPSVLQDFRTAHPTVEVVLREMPTDAQLAALRADEVHVGILRLADHDLRGLRTELVRRERHVAALPEAHPLAERGVVPLRALADVPLVALAPDVQPVLHRRVAAACAAAGFTPRIVQTARTVHTLTALVAAGLGVALVPESARDSGRSGVAWRPVRGRLPPVEISAAWRAWNPSPSLALFRPVLARHREVGRRSG